MPQTFSAKAVAFRRSGLLLAARCLVAAAWISTPPWTSGQEQPYVDPDRPEEPQRPFSAPAAIVLEASIGPRQGWDGSALGGDISARVRIRGFAGGALVGGEWTGRMYDADPDNLYLGAMLGIRQRTPGGLEIEVLGEGGRRGIRVFRGLFESGYKWIALPYVGARAGLSWDTGGPLRVSGGLWMAARIDLGQSGVELATRANLFGDTNTRFRHIGGIALLVQLRLGTEIILSGG